MGQSSKAKYWRSVFRRVMSRYDELKSVQGTFSCEAFYKRLENGANGSIAPKVVRVLPEDFFADVEIAARRALDDREHQYFAAVYLDKQEGYDDAANEYHGTALKHSVQEKVGKMLHARKIYPLQRYFRPKDLR
jgi:hypothetical protein